MGQWYRMRRNLQSDVRPFYPGYLLPALCIYISGIWLPALLFWLFILMAQSTERLKMFVIRFLSTFKILMAALYLSGGFSVLYLLIIKQ